MPRIVDIRTRNDTAANWTAANPVLSVGEVGVETDTRLIKIGNGATTWTALDYANRKLFSGTTRQTNPMLGEMFEDAATDQIDIWNGTAWVQIV